MKRPNLKHNLRNIEQHLANQSEERQKKAIDAHIAAVSASIGSPLKRGDEAMPYRLHIAIAFASLASALVSLYVWLP